MARRAAKPFKKQLESAEAHQARVNKKLHEAKVNVEARQQQIADDQKALAVERAVVPETEATANTAAAEFPALVARFASEHNAAAPAASEPAAMAPGSTVPPGCASIAYAA